MSFEMIGEGATAKIYRDGHKATKRYADMPIKNVQAEAERQSFAAKAGLPVPAVYDVRALDDGSVAFDMEYIDGKPMIEITFVDNAPVIAADLDLEDLAQMLQTVIKLQCAIHAVSGVGLRRHKDVTSQRIRQLSCFDTDIKNRLLSLYETLDSGKECLCHGDFHPSNILFDGKKHWVIDWVDAMSGDPYADVCRTYLLCLQGMPEVAPFYLKAYCAATKATEEGIVAWLPILAASRMTEGTLNDEMRAMLRHIVEQWAADV